MLEEFKMSSTVDLNSQNRRCSLFKLFALLREINLYLPSTLSIQCMKENYNYL